VEWEWARPLRETGPFTGRFGGQMAAEPDHLPPEGATETPLPLRRTDLRGLSLMTQLLTLLAPATPLELFVVHV